MKTKFQYNENIKSIVTSCNAPYGDLWILHILIECVVSEYESQGRIGAIKEKNTLLRTHSGMFLISTKNPRSAESYSCELQSPNEKSPLLIFMDSHIKANRDFAIYVRIATIYRDV